MGFNFYSEHKKIAGAVEDYNDDTLEKLRMTGRIMDNFQKKIDSLEVSIRDYSWELRAIKSRLNEIEGIGEAGDEAELAPDSEEEDSGEQEKVKKK